MSFITITSADNQTIKQFSKLKQKKYREKEGRYITEGLRSSGEILKTDKDAVFVITERFLSDFSDFCDTLSSQKVYVVTDKIFNSLTDTESPQGILCVSTIKKASEKLQKPYYIYLDRLTDPGNVGTVIRTCHAFGFGGVLLAPGSCDVYSGKVIRSAMGSHLYTDIYTDFSYEALADLKKDGYKIFSTALIDESVSLYECKFGEKAIFVIGNEANGVSDEILSLSDETLIIPMPGGAESLNASVAAALVMSEAVRTKRG
ncbi:MAG: RNA methyltransferase [Clostridia bacterium]|nr:RNA methyltransferase [Clostridia bacterium]